MPSAVSSTVRTGCAPPAVTVGASSSKVISSVPFAGDPSLSVTVKVSVAVASFSSPPAACRTLSSNVTL